MKIDMTVIYLVTCLNSSIESDKNKEGNLLALAIKNYLTVMILPYFKSSH